MEQNEQNKELQVETKNEPQQVQRKSMILPKKYLIVGVAIVIAIIALLLFIFSGSGKTTVSVETSLREVILASELRTATYTYNSIATVSDEDGNELYHVAYKGTVVAGIDFEKIQVERDGTVIRVILPAVEIFSTNVNPEMEYIFAKKKNDTETTYAEAYAACEEHLTMKAKDADTLIETAKESAVDTITALMKPFEKRLQEGETIEIIFAAEEGMAQ